ncbi:MAG: PAS domain S-box-containing protein [Salinirussus sp.]|jgi:PAS domain S-box-containing protein
MEYGLRVLYVYDACEPASLNGETLTREGDGLAVETAHSVGGALECLAADTFDCVLSTYRLPDEDGLTLLRRVRERDPDLPFVLYTHRGTERIASEAVSAGVTEYIRNDPAVDQTGTVAGRIQDAVEGSQREPEPRLRELTEATEDVLWLISADWDEVLFVNSAYSTIWGESEERLRADPLSFLEAVHPDDRSRARRAVDRLTEGESVEIELRVNPADDFGRHVVVQAEPVFGRDGSVSRVAGASREVTEERARQRRLAEEERLTESVFAALPDVLYTFDTDGYLLRWNDQLEAETGYEGSEITEMHVTGFVPADEVETIAGRFQSVIEDRSTVTVESAFETKAGERVPFEFTGAPLEAADGSLRGVTGVGRNIAERKRQQRRFEAVFNNTYQFTGLMSPGGTLLEVNSAAVEFAGQSRDELVGQKVWDAYWFQGNEEAALIARRAVDTAADGEFFREQITVQGDDREAVIDFSVRPVTDADGTVELLIPEGRDITRLSQREQQLNVTNRFLRHDIRNKLTTIQGYAELVSTADDSETRSYGDTILRAAAEIDGVAELARQIHALITDEPTPKPVGLVEQLERAVAVTEDRYPHADITVDAPESLAVRSLASLDEALAELLAAVLTNTTGNSPRLAVKVAHDDTAIVELPSVGGRLPSADREVLTGEIDIEQVRHADGLGVWYVYWHIWYSGGTVTVTDADGCIRVHLPTA